MNKEEFIDALDRIFGSDQCAIHLYFVMKVGGVLSVKKPEINADNKQPILNSLRVDYENKKANLKEIDRHVSKISGASDASEGVLEYDLQQEPETFKIIREVYDNRERDDYFSAGNGRKFGGEDQLSNIYGFVFLLHTPDDRHITIYRKAYFVNIFKRSTRFFFDGNRIKHFDKELMNIEGKIDYLLLDNTFFIFNEKSLEKNEDIKIVMKNAAVRNLGVIANTGLTGNLDTIAERINKEPSFARKIVNFSTNSPVMTMKAAAVIAHIKENRALYGDIHIGVDNKIVLDTKKEQEAFIKMLNEDFLTSSLTGQNYDATRKRPIAKARNNDANN